MFEALHRPRGLQDPAARHSHTWNAFRRRKSPVDKHRSINAVAESFFFATIKGEMLDHQTFETRPEATAAIADYVDAFYNVHRLHSSIGYVSPIEFEMKLSRQTNQVAA